MAKSHQFPPASGPAGRSTSLSGSGHSCWQRLFRRDRPKGYVGTLGPGRGRRPPHPRQGTGATRTGLLIHHRISDGEYAFYRAHAPRPVPGRRTGPGGRIRWKIEESFAGGKELAALDGTTSPARPPGTAGPSCAMLAHAFL